MFRIFDGKNPSCIGGTCSSLYFVMFPTLAPSHLGILDYVSRKIPQFALHTNTALPALSLCRRPNLCLIFSTIVNATWVSLPFKLIFPLHKLLLHRLIFIQQKAARIHISRYSFNLYLQRGHKVYMYCQAPLLSS